MEWGGGISSVREQEDGYSSIPLYAADFPVSPQLSFLYPVSPVSPELLGGHGPPRIPCRASLGSAFSWRGFSS